MSDTKRPKISSEAERELDKAVVQFESFKEQVDSLTFDVMNEAPKKEVEPQTKIAQSDIADSKDIYLKPIKSIGSREKFNEKYRASYEFDKEYVYFTAENKECPGETIDLWTKPYAGMSAEEWKVPVNKPIWGPRYLANRLKDCTYHILTMEPGNGVSGSDYAGTYQGSVAVKQTINRLDAIPATKRRSIFMGAQAF
jgi:hypothetical protein